MTLHMLHSESLIYEENLIFFFISVPTRVDGTAAGVNPKLKADI
jgi:hypothetical protein